MTEFTDVIEKTTFDGGELVLGASSPAQTVAQKYSLAAWDTNRRTLNVVDYGAVHDGTTDDAPAIQAAIAAMSSGDALYFPQGVYTVGSASWVGFAFTGLSDIHVYSDAAQIKPTVDPSQAVHSGNGSTVIFKFTTCDDVLVSGLCFIGNGIDCAAISYEECTRFSQEKCGTDAGFGVAAGDTAGIFSDAKCTGGLYLANVIEGGGGQLRGIWSGDSNVDHNSDGIAFIGNRISNCVATGIVLQSSHCLAMGNVVDGCWSGIISSVADTVLNGHHTITGNIMRNNTAHGYQSDVTGTDLLEYVTVSNNVIVGNNNSGLYINKTSKATFSANMIYGNNTSASASGMAVFFINSTDVAVSDNTIDGAGNNGHGVNICEGANHNVNLTVTGNTITNFASGRGIFCEANSTGSLKGAVIANNIITGNQYGMYIRQSNASGLIENVHFDSNIVKDNTSGGIHTRCVAASGSTQNISMTNNIADNVSWATGSTVAAALLPRHSSGNTWDTDIVALTSSIGQLLTTLIVKASNGTAAQVSGYTLQAPTRGMRVELVSDNPAQALRAIPNSGGTIGGGGIDKYAEVEAGNAAVFECHIDGVWTVSGPVTYEP